MSIHTRSPGASLRLYFIIALIISILILTARLVYAQPPDGPADSTTTADTPIPIPIFDSVWSMLLLLFNVALIPFLVDRFAPVTWKSGTKMLVLIVLSLIASVLQLLAENRLDLKNLVGSTFALLGLIQVHYNLLIKKFGLNGPKEQILSLAKQQIAKQIDVLSHSEAREVLDSTKPPSIQLTAEVK